MRRGRTVAQQHDILVMPFLAEHPVEVQPGRAAQVAGIAHQRMAVQMRGKDLLASGNAFILGHLAKAPFVIGLLAAFHDKSRCVGIELVGMGPDPAMFGLFEDEGEGVVELGMGAQPDELAGAGVDLGLEMLRVMGAHPGIDAIRRDHQVIFGRQRVDIIGLGLKAQVHPQFAGAFLQQQQQPHPPDAAKTMPGRHRAGVLVDHRDIVPIGKMRVDRLGAFRVVGLEIRQRFIGQHHAPAKGIVRLVALDDGDVMGRIAQFQADREIETGRTSTQAHDFHKANLLIQGFLRRGCQQPEDISSLKYLA